MGQETWNAAKELAKANAENERLRAALYALAHIANDISKKDTLPVFQRMWRLADEAKQLLSNSTAE